jgi:hypothetical protein
VKLPPYSCSELPQFKTVSGVPPTSEEATRQFQKEQAFLQITMTVLSTTWFNSKIRSKQTTIVFQGAVAINTMILIVAVPVAIDRTDSELRNKWLASSPPKPRRIVSEKRRKFEDLIEANRRRIDGNFPNLLASQIELGVA